MNNILALLATIKQKYGQMPATLENYLAYIGAVRETLSTLELKKQQTEDIVNVVCFGRWCEPITPRTTRESFVERMKTKLIEMWK